MAWLNKLNTERSWRPALVAVALASATLGGCNVGKSDTVTTTGTGATYSSSCAGSYVGGYEMPDQATRIEMRNRSLTDRGIAVTGNDAIDNANAGGGPPDGGIWMSGSFSFETDANCNVTSGKTFIFHQYEYGISGTVNKDGTFTLTWSGQGSSGEMIGQVNANRSISGKFHHPLPDSYVHGVLSGTFTPR